MSQRLSVWETLAGLAVASAAGFAAYVFAIRPWHRRWGATDEEVAVSMPGDDLVPDANFYTTRAIVPGMVRWRARWVLLSSAAPFLIGLTLDPIEFLMEQKMMRGIKERAEASTQAEGKESHS